MRLACTLSRYKYVLCARGFLKLACLGGWRGGLFSVLQRPAPSILIFIPDHTLDWGKAGVFVFPVLMRKPRTREQTWLGGPSRKWSLTFWPFSSHSAVQAQLQDRMRALNSRIWMLTSQFNTVEKVIFLMISLWFNQIKVTKNVNSAARPRFESWLCYSLPAWLRAISK